MPLPDFFVLGAPKAGTTALHGALATHPQLYLSPIKEPKYFLCDGGPPTLVGGPGDAHSARELARTGPILPASSQMAPSPSRAALGAPAQ